MANFVAQKFQSATDASIVSNKVGANKAARRAALAWAAQLERGKAGLEREQVKYFGVSVFLGGKQIKMIFCQLAPTLSPGE